MMIVKKHVAGEGRLVLAVCDSDILGKKFENEHRQLDLSSDFYAGEELTHDEVLGLMKKAYILNLVGKSSVGLGIETGLVDKDNIDEINNVPYAQVLVAVE